MTTDTNQEHDAHRRAFLRDAARLTAAAAAGPVLLAGCAGDGRTHLATADDVHRTIDALRKSAGLRIDGAWNPQQVYTHLAQSVEYSMIGYPESKSALFQATVGSAAFAVFAWRGHMQHDLGAPIPGAPDLPAEGDWRPALERFAESFNTFLEWQGPLRPHFAYGELSRDEYLIAHIMHLDNHLDQFRPRPGA